MRVRVMCTNEGDKRWFNIIREVTYPHLGQGVYLKGEVYCGCGHQLKEVQR